MDEMRGVEIVHRNESSIPATLIPPLVIPNLSPSSLSRPDNRPISRQWLQHFLLGHSRRNVQ
jgi:hypothetical protein